MANPIPSEYRGVANTNHEIIHMVRVSAGVYDHCRSHLLVSG